MIFNVLLCEVRKVKCFPAKFCMGHTFSYLTIFLRQFKMIMYILDF